MKDNVLFDSFPVLESENIVLKKIEEIDLEELFSIYSNDNVFKYCGIIPKKNKETVKNMIEHFERDYNKKSRIKWGIYYKQDNMKLVGIIEVFDINQKINMVTIGYFLAEAYWKKGIATESLKILVRYLFENVGVNRIQAEVMPDNNESKKVLIKNGFIKEGALRQASLWSGKGVVDLEVYGLLYQDYKI
ncbi:GNAT family N-acetyltransferase [Clostridium sp. YIM B02515]|uniref:GNAT family N-acetyltransferase n=1 Tax=Clostridium rhizosphaerae TaxID=2803861 RepID=A0ABS1TE87_9CLOT|nr:GNAT family protein [Clostridium rhizosphaerae]MBL4937693.1 GNAT family N-acetyltransferase [Clostridium rhizosphaerae]